MRRVLLGIVMLIAAVVPIGAALAAGPSPDGFYDPPVPLPTGQPGDIVKVESVKVSMDYIRFGLVQGGTDPGPVLPIPPGSIGAWRIMHLGTTATGEPQALTAIVMVPTAAWSGPGRRPLVAYPVGGHGMGPQCTPSWQMMHGTQPELGSISGLLNNGFAVVATDYQRRPLHTFAEPESAARAVLDSIRAATRLEAQRGIETGLDHRNPVLMLGYSQGGNATAAAAERQPSYAPEIDLRGVVTGGVPADLIAVARAVDGENLFAAIFFAINALATAYPDLDIGDLPLNAAGVAAVVDVRSLCIEEASARYGYRRTSEFTVGGLSFDQALDAAPDWKARLQALRIGQGRPEVPVLVVHGLLDPWVPYDVGLTMAKGWCTHNADLAFASYPAEHFGALIMAMPEVMQWLRARATGQPAFTSGMPCGQPPLTGPAIPIPDLFL